MVAHDFDADRFVPSGQENAGRDRHPLSSNSSVPLQATSQSSRQNFGLSLTIPDLNQRPQPGAEPQPRVANKHVYRLRSASLLTNVSHTTLSDATTSELRIAFRLHCFL